MPPFPIQQTESEGALLSDWSFDSDFTVSAGGDDASAPAVAPPLREHQQRIGDALIRYVQGEFWTAGQRQACSIHEVSYRACFKPQLPAYFIKRFTGVDDVVYDPFSGRGTTAIEAALRGRRVIANDVSPLTHILARPRLAPPSIKEIEVRLQSISLKKNLKADIDLSMFYDARTESEIITLRNYLKKRKKDKKEDAVDQWIRMVATNRLTGHSSGFFSVYSFPPNQAVSQKSQTQINAKRSQIPTYRNTKEIILKKSRQLLKGVSSADTQCLHRASESALFITNLAGATHSIASESVQLTVTSPPFLDVVQYADDNWLRCWFNNIPTARVASRITMAKTLQEWLKVMAEVFKQLYRITRYGGVVAFEVGEIRKGSIKLEEYVVPLGIKSGFTCQAVLINEQTFTKTANIWGISNNKSGTNSNRIAVFSKL